MKLDIGIIAAKGLPKLNPKYPQKPYCTVQVQDMEPTFKTKTSLNGVNPEWNETFTFTGLSIETTVLTLSFTVYNKDKVISSISFDINEITPGELKQDWVDLIPENYSKSKPKSGGKLNFSIQFTSEPDDIQPTIEEEATNEPDSPSQASQSAASSYSPQASIDIGSPIYRYKLKTDNNVAEVESQARENATEAYRAFLQTAAPGLINNSQIVEKNHENQNE